MATNRILVVDDEPLIQEVLCVALERKNYAVEWVEDGKEALKRLKEGDFDLIVTDIRMPGVSGMEILRRAKEIDPNIGVILITAFGSIKNAVQAMKEGAFDYITKPFSIDEVEMTVEKFFQYQRLVHENLYLRTELGRRYGIENIVGRSPKMQAVFEQVYAVAPSNATVLIQGPSGTGKELIARAIHELSPRRNRAFVKTNCAALPEGLVESELFGHEKGAFTGAIRRTKGRFELADGGTLLLDEISEISASLQAKLLRVLQEKEFEKVGNPETVSVDVRVIATTNRDLREEIAAGRFREDLFYRLNVVPINLPPLCERKEDIPLLVDHFVEKYSRQNSRVIEGVEPEVMDKLLSYSWPGNVRELENVVERAVVISRGPVLTARDFFVGDEYGVQRRPVTQVPTDLTLREMEREMILKALQENNNNRTWAARKLGISVRTLRNKLREYREEGFLVDGD